MLKERNLQRPLCLGIPRGGVVIASVLAQELGGDLDVALARKLRAPDQPELAVGAIGEDGVARLNTFGDSVARMDPGYLSQEIVDQTAEIKRRRRLIRAIRSAAPIAGRSVIVSDDGIATGSTMIAALQVIRAQEPAELLVASPVVAPDCLPLLRQRCDDVIFLLSPGDFFAIGQFYGDFHQVDDEEMLALLR